MLEIGIEEKDKTVIFSIAGELSSSTVDEFDRSFKKYINSEFDVIALDLQYMPFLDSFAMNRIIKVSRTFAGSSRQFVLLNMNDAILNTFKIAGFEKFFKIMTGEEFNKKYFPGNDGKTDQ